MMDRQFRGYPQRYQGRVYRSRLETRWATFFDLCSWPYEYEPFDLNGWVPDFAIFGCSDHPLLVEVKPFTKLEQFDEAIAKAERACRGNPEFERCELLLLGPRIFVGRQNEDSVALGWLGEIFESFPKPGFEWGFSEAIACDHGKVLDFCHDLGSYGCRVSGEYTGNVDAADPDVVRTLWNDAANSVQWRAPAAGQVSL